MLKVKFWQEHELEFREPWVQIQLCHAFKVYPLSHDLPFSYAVKVKWDK